MRLTLALRPSLGVVTAAALVVVGCSDQTTLAPELQPAPTPNLATAAATLDRTLNDHVIVVRNGQRPSDELVAAIEAAGGTIHRRHDQIGVLTVNGLSDEAASALGARSDIGGIQRDVLVQWIPPVESFHLEVVQGPTAETDQSGAFFFDQYQWNMRQIKADKAWLVSPQGQGALVCVLDSGVDAGHLDLNGKVNLAKSTSFVDDEPFIEDLLFHGTFVSALIASNGIGMASVAPDAELCAVKVLSSEGSGSFDDVIAGIVYATEVGADVINLSLGALVLRSEAKDLIDALTAAVRYAGDHGTLVVASAGNESIDFDQYLGIAHLPSMVEGVLSVGATAPVNQMHFDALASYTNYGKRGVDVTAPGGDLVDGGVFEDLILSACSQYVCGDIDFYLLGAGTSFSAPHAVGEAAVIESAAPGDQGPRDLTACIKGSADKIDGLFISPFYGSGRINVLRAIRKKGCGGIGGGGGGGPTL